MPSGDRYDFVGLVTATDEMLEAVLRMGIRPSFEELLGWEFGGYMTWDLTELVGRRKFKKGFYLEDRMRPAADGINGYNVKVIQNSLGDPWIDVVEHGESVKHGYFNVYPVQLTEVDARYPHAVLLNYQCTKNGPLEPLRVLRDYLVQVYPDNPDLLLGKIYLAVGPLRLFVSYFALERINRSPL